jgi:hypothetical protein
VFVALSIWLVTLDRPRAVVAGVFSLFLVISVRLVRRSGPALVIDTRGTTDRSSPVAAGFVRGIR